MNIERPYVLFLFLPLFVWIWFYFKRGLQKNKSEFLLATQNNEKYSFYNFYEILPVFRFLAIFLIILALSGLGREISLLPDETKGVDIMVALDVSGSMALGTDMPPSRLEVSKELLKNFIMGRKSDRLGLVLFAGAAYLQSPLTSDLSTLAEVIGEARQESVLEAGTAIGDAILLSAYRLKNSKAKSRIVILITDGVSNAGKLDPHSSAEAANKFGIKIYSIGIGRDVPSFFGGGDSTDFGTLKEISELTGGKFYRAIDSQELTEVLTEIDSLETDKLEAKPKKYTQSYFKYFLIPAMLLLGIDFLLRGIVWKFAL